MIVAESKRLRLRHVNEDDFDFLFEIFNNQDAMKYYTSLRDAEKTREWMKLTFQHYQKFGFGKWMIETPAGEVVGHTGITNLSIDGVSEFELGYFLHPRFWKKGFAVEAAQMSLDLAVNKFALPRIVSAINPANSPSIRVAEKLGLKKEKSGIASIGSFSWPCDVYANQLSSKK